jgi:uncharacterized membrane protein
MFERLNDYKKKCKVLKQIQSNKALFYRRINNIQNFITVFVSAFITFIGFSGTGTIKEYLQILTNNQQINVYWIQMVYNILVFILFFVVIFHLVFQFNSKQTESERAISLLSDLINEIDDLSENFQSHHTIESISDKYTLITKVIPSNTDREYKNAKKSLEQKTKEVKTIEKRNLITLTSKEQEEYIIRLIEKNQTVQLILNALRDQSEELFLGGGVIRNIIWDDLHNYKEMTPIDDVDIIYFDKLHTSKDYDIEIENKLKSIIPNYKWSVKNQARMHTINNDDPYSSLPDAVSKWPETVSAMLLRKELDGKYLFIAPFDFDDLFRLIVRPTPYFMHKLDKYQSRIKSKNWKDKWDKLKILYMD